MARLPLRRARVHHPQPRRQVDAGLDDLDRDARAGLTGAPAAAIYEHGKREPSVSTLARIVHATGSTLVLDVAVDDVLAAPTGPRLDQRLRQQREAVIATVAAHGGSNVRVFGSVARGEARAGSDLDLLIDLPERSGILTHGAIARDVERLVGAEVDVVPAFALRPAFRDRILAEAVPL